MGPTRRVEGRHADGGGVLAVPVVWGLSGVGPAPVPLSATVPVCRTTGAAPWSRDRGAGSWASAGYGARADRCLAAGPGGWTVNHKRAGAHRAAGGARGAVSATEGEAVCGRPAGPGSGCALPTAIHVWAHRPGWRPEPTIGRPLAAAGRGRARHTRQPSRRPGWPDAFPGRQVCSPVSPSCSIAHRCLPRTRAPATRPRVHQPGRAGLA